MEPGPSILNMAEAMLADEYKSSHTSLKSFAVEDEDDSNNKGDENAESMGVEGEGKRTEPIMPTMTTATDSSSPREKRSEGRSVVIQVPPKRRKLSSAASFTPKEIVDGKNFEMSPFTYNLGKQ